MGALAHLLPNHRANQGPTGASAADRGSAPQKTSGIEITNPPQINNNPPHVVVKPARASLESQLQSFLLLSAESCQKDHDPRDSQAAQEGTGPWNPCSSRRRYCEPARPGSAED